MERGRCSTAAFHQQAEPCTRLRSRCCGGAIAQLNDPTKARFKDLLKTILLGQVVASPPFF